jgi:steroid delta-isomerase-like uncharacterized protein
MDANQKKATVRRYIAEIWNKGNVGLVDELMAESYENHDPASPGGVLKGREAFKTLVTEYRKGIQQMTMEIKDQYADGDVVVTRWHASGVHLGPMMGIPATGRTGKGVEGITITTFSGDTIVRDQAVWDTLGLLRQLGVLPA